MSQGRPIRFREHQERLGRSSRVDEQRNTATHPPPKMNRRRTNMLDDWVSSMMRRTECIGSEYTSDTVGPSRAYDQIHYKVQ